MRRNQWSGQGLKASFSARLMNVRFTLKSGTKADNRTTSRCAKAEGRCAPARCAEAGAERPVAGREDSNSNWRLRLINFVQDSDAAAFVIGDEMIRKFSSEVIKHDVGVVTA